jgi:bifunctional non-homologous end joining protein LigD
LGLPFFISPMLAVLGSPFDSGDYIFEVKWDGYRALLFREKGSYRLMSRNALDMTGQFPELQFMSGLPDGTVLDGEIVALVDGMPDFEALRSGRGSGGDAIIAYFAFDLLYENYSPQMMQPLMKRKEELEKIIAPFLQERLVLNAYVETNGTLFFEKVRDQGLEGIMAKSRTGLYLPGRRDDSWKKIKRSQERFCVIIGYTPDESGVGFKSLILATDIDGQLKYVGKVGTGFSQKFREELFLFMRPLVVSSPIIPCPEKGVWVNPEIFCKIRFAEFTNAGVLRAPVFKSLVA